MDKLRQWAGEVISSSRSDKVSDNDEFKELEKDIELRKDGLSRLLTASEAYHRALTKKKDSDAVDESDKLLPIDSLGIVMIVHGEEFGEDSAFGNAMVKLGRAHCKVATLQEAYALTFRDTFMVSMVRFKEEIKTCEGLKKTYETRRSAYDSAIAKFEKLQNGKKEKDRREAEEEMERARQRYEETAEDLRAHMHAVQENEFGQLRELTSFLDVETNYVQSYLDVLKDVKAEWQQITKAGGRRSRRPSQSISAVYPLAKSNSVGSTKSRKHNPYVDSSDDEGQATPARRPSLTRNRSGSTASARVPSRPASRLSSRKRTNSSAASGSSPVEKDEKEKPRRLSVAGWASSAVESVTGGKKEKKKDKDKDSFASLGNDPDEVVGETAAPTMGRSSSFRGLGKRGKNKSKENLPTTPKAQPKILKPPSLDRKVVRALYDFSGSSDELSFKAGTEIVVVNEVIDDWWMGEVNGKQGLFPTSYTEVATLRPSNGYAVNPPTVKEAPTGTGALGLGLGGFDEYVTSDDDHDLHAQPMTIGSPFYGGGFGDTDTIGFSDIADSEDDSERKPVASVPLVVPTGPAFDGQVSWVSPNGHLGPSTITPPLPARPRKRSLINPADPLRRPLIDRDVEPSDDDDRQPTQTLVTPAAVNTTPRKIPPPPPPRRPSVQPGSGQAGPPIPERKVPRAHGSELTPPSSISSLSLDVSPFDSAVELVSTNGSGIKRSTCTQFKQNPFKSAGMCSTCLEYHR